MSVCGGWAYLHLDFLTKFVTKSYYIDSTAFLSKFPCPVFLLCNTSDHLCQSILLCLIVGGFELAGG